MDPAKLQVGDIVEVKVSFTAVELKASEYKVMCVLRAVTLLDGKYTQVRHRSASVVDTQLTQRQDAFKRRLVATMPFTTQPSLKRRLGYVEEEVAEARAKLSRLDIEGNKGARDDATDQ